MKVIKQINNQVPKTFEANRTQINVGVKELDDGSYSYTTVIIENPENYTDEALLEIASNAARSSAMLEGDVYTLDGKEYRVSFTKDDGDGIMQVKSAFELGLTSTTIHFENGTRMPISAAEFGAFAAWFVAKRNEFFV